MWVLVDQTNGTLHQLNENGLTFVGREPSNEIAVSARSVEQWRHAVLAKDAGGPSARFRLKDLGSTHGTFVNSVRLDSNSDDWFVLNERDVIRFGGVDAITFRLEVCKTPGSEQQQSICKGCIAEQAITHTCGVPYQADGQFYCAKHVPKNIVSSAANHSSGSSTPTIPSGGLMQTGPSLYLAAANPATLFSAAGTPAFTTSVFAAYPVTMTPANAAGATNQNATSTTGYVTAMPFLPQGAFIATTTAAGTGAVKGVDISAQTSPTRSLSNSTGSASFDKDGHSATGYEQLDALQAAVAAASSPLVAGGRGAATSSTASITSLKGNKSSHDAINKNTAAAVAASSRRSSAASTTPSVVAGGGHHHNEAENNSTLLPLPALDSGFGESLEAMTLQAANARPSTSPPVRDRISPVLPTAKSSSSENSSSTMKESRAEALAALSPVNPSPPTAFTVDFGSTGDVVVNLADGDNSALDGAADAAEPKISINDSLSKFLPSRLRAKQQQQEEEKARSREAIARDLKQQQSKNSKNSKLQNNNNNNVKPGKDKAAAANASMSSNRATGTNSSGLEATTSASAKLPEQYSEHTLYKEAAEFDRRIAANTSSSASAASTSRVPASAPLYPSFGSDEREPPPGDDADKSSECGTYTIAIEDGGPAEVAADYPPALEAHAGNGQYPWQSVLDKFFASAPKQSSRLEDHYDADDVTPSASPSGSGSTTDGLHDKNAAGGMPGDDISKLEAEIDRLAQERAMNISVQDVKAVVVASGQHQQQRNPNATPQPQLQPQPPSAPSPSNPSTNSSLAQQLQIKQQQSNSRNQQSSGSSKLSAAEAAQSRSLPVANNNGGPSSSSSAVAAARASNFQMPPPPVLSKNLASSSLRRPNSAGYSGGGQYQSSTAPSSTAVRSSTLQASQQDSSLVQDSLSTELLLQDTEKVVKSLADRQAQRQRQQQQQQQQLSVTGTAVHAAQASGAQMVRLSPRNAPERRSAQTRPRRPIVPTTSSGRASSTSRNTLTSVGSNLDTADSASDVSSSTRDRVFARLSTPSAQRMAASRTPATVTTVTTTTTASINQRQPHLSSHRAGDAASVSSSSTTAGLESPRLQSRQSLGTKIVLKSRDNARLEQFRGAAAMASVSNSGSRSSRTRLQAKPTVADEQRAKELEAWRRRKGYDPRRSVAEERAQKRSSRCSSLSRNSVESNDESDFPVSSISNAGVTTADDSQDQPREIYDDFGSYQMDEDEFILVYDGDPQPESQSNISAAFNGGQQQSSGGLPGGDYNNGGVNRGASILSGSGQADSLAGSYNYYDSPETPRPNNKQYQHLKDGRRVLVLTDEAWTKPDCVSPTTNQVQQQLQTPLHQQVAATQTSLKLSQSSSDSRRSSVRDNESNVTQPTVIQKPQIPATEANQQRNHYRTSQQQQQQSTASESSSHHSLMLNGGSAAMHQKKPSQPAPASSISINSNNSATPSAAGTTMAVGSTSFTSPMHLPTTATKDRSAVMSSSTAAYPAASVLSTDTTASMMQTNKSNSQQQNAQANGTSAASLERVDGLILSSVYRLAAKLTDRAASVVGKPAPVRQHNPGGGSSKAQMSTESQLVGTLTELHRLERLIDEIAEVVSSSSISSASQTGGVLSVGGGGGGGGNSPGQLLTSPNSSLYASGGPSTSTSQHRSPVLPSDHLASSLHHSSTSTSQYRPHVYSALSASASPAQTGTGGFFDTSIELSRQQQSTGNEDFF